MQLYILAIGKESSSTLLEIQQTYEQRLKPYAAVEWKILPASRLSDPIQIREQESTQILNHLKPTDSIILLDERGQQQTNEAFAATFERFAGSHGRLVFVIGGAFGVNEALRSRASFVWSLSKLVFPHQLIRIMLLEQIYRTFMIKNGHPYHHT